MSSYCIGVGATVSKQLKIYSWEGRKILKQMLLVVLIILILSEQAASTRLLDKGLLSTTQQFACLGILSHHHRHKQIFLQTKALRQKIQTGMCLRVLE